MDGKGHRLRRALLPMSSERYRSDDDSQNLAVDSVFLAQSNAQQAGLKAGRRHVIAALGTKFVTLTEFGGILA